MKKNLLFTALAATTLLFATSCQQDEVFVDGNEATVTFEVGTPEIATRAYSDGLTATKLQWAVYHDNNGVDNDTPVMRDGKHLTGEATLEDGKASVNIQLAAGKGYNVLFWADAYGKDEQNKPYDVNLAEKKLTITDYSTVKSNDESRDAFYCYRPITVGTANTTETIILTRPFAQLNIGTNDLAIALADGIDVSKTGVKISEVYNTLNFVDGTVSGLVEEQVFALSTRPEAYSAENTDGEKFPVDGYDYLAMNYILVGANKTVVDVDFSYGDATTRTRTYTGIPVQANYRTNIYGALLTQGIDFDVEIVPGYNGNIPGDDMLDQLIIASQVGGEITLSEDITTDGVITVAENVELTINLNGKTITGAMPRSVGGVIKNNGTLTIKGGTISSTATDGGSAVYSTGNLTLENVTLNGAPYGTGTTYPSYALNIYGKNTHLKNVTINGTHGALAAVSNGTTIVEDCNLTVSGRNNSDHVFYLNHADAKVTVKGGTYTNNDTGYSYVAYVGAGELTLEDGTFSAPNVASTKGMATGTEGKIFVKGGTFGFDPSEYVAPGYFVNQEGDKYIVNDYILATTTEGLQAALDAAKNGGTINLKAGVNYGVVYMGRPTKYNATTMFCETHNYTTTDAAEFVAHLGDGQWHTTPRYTTTLKNLTIVGANGATIAGLVTTSGHAYGDVYDYVREKDYDSGSAYYNTLHMENIKFSNVSFTGKIDINTSDETTTYNGITFEGCTFTTGGTASSNGAAIRYYNEANNGNVKNIVVKNCKFNNCYQGVYLHHVNGITITGSKFNTTGHNAIAIQGHDGAVDLKSVVITNNTFENIADRVIRFNEVGADSQITIQRNTATNSGDTDGEVMKATSIEDGITTNIGYNNWNGGIVVNPELKDSVTEVDTYDKLVAAITTIKKGGKIELTGDITATKWVMFSETLSIGNGNIITVDEINVTIDGKGHTLTVNSIESARNGNYLFYDASNLNIYDLTIKYADGLAGGGIHLTSGVISLVNFVGGDYGILPGNGNIKVEECTFATNGTAIYFEAERDNLQVMGCTFNQPAGTNVILLRGNVKFRNNIVNSGRTVNIVSGSPDVYGNNFNDVRLKVYSAATATIAKNTINNLVFETTTYSSTFTENILSTEAEAALNAATKI